MEPEENNPYPAYMEPERADGNVEYKLKLTDKSSYRIEGLATQMRYRCEEGGSECIYNIGVEDDGTMTGITEQEYEESIAILNSAADKNNYTVNLLSTTPTENGRCVYEVLIRECNEDQYIDIKVAVAGSVDVGKCLSPDTPVIMFDGTVRPVQSVEIGDTLMGDDSAPRKVCKIYQGSDDMYEIFQTRGDSYRVTSNHILTLMFGAPTVRKYKDRFVAMWHSGGGKLERDYFYDLDEARGHILTVPNVSTVDISVKDYMAQGKAWKTMFLGYCVPVSFPEQYVSIDPYLLGLWLGDGDSSRPCLATFDAPVLEKVSDIAVQRHGKSIHYRVNGAGTLVTRSTNQSGTCGIQFRQHAK